MQSRAKTVSSFAEKCARKYGETRKNGKTYTDPVNEFSDLCGGRVIVQTLTQVQAVCQFIETNFDILDKDDKNLQLSEDEFGYRDIHYIIRLLPDMHTGLGVSPSERDQIGSRRAELQVRTWLQHAWADTMHDRIYKNSLKLSTQIRRSGALLAALLEEGDLNVVRMTEELDGMIANYTAFASRTDVNSEIAIQRLILQNEPEEHKKPGLALKLARLMEACGNYAGVVEILEPHHELTDANRTELLQSLGFSLCKLNKNSPRSDAFKRGLRFLEAAMKLCENPELRFVPNLRMGQSLHARVLSRLGWAESLVQGQKASSRKHRVQAHEQEPSNPYYLADMLGFEMNMMRVSGLPSTMRTVLREALKTSGSHAANGIELPYSYFTTGRLSWLLEQPKAALGHYARGVRQYLYGEQNFPADVLEEEINWLMQIYDGQPTISPDCQSILDLLELAKQIRTAGTDQPVASKHQVLIIAGDETGIPANRLAHLRPVLAAALQAFSGQLIVDGVDSGIRGLIEDITVALEQAGAKHFERVEDASKPTPSDGQHGHSADPASFISRWQGLLEHEIHPQEIVLLGIGGGPSTAVEFRVALSLGAAVAVLAGTGGAADGLIADELWSGSTTLIPLVFDPASVWAYFAPSSHSIGESVVEKMAERIHANYCASNTKDLKENMQPWQKLKETYKNANRGQAKFSIQIVEAAGFVIREAEQPKILDDLTPAEIERMAELEHGRWNVDRLKDQWRPGPRDNAKKLHDCLIPWEDLPEHIKFYDREAVAQFPAVLAQAGFEIYRK